MFNRKNSWLRHYKKKWENYQSSRIQTYKDKIEKK